jgi:hypothetical protein
MHLFIKHIKCQNVQLKNFSCLLLHVSVHLDHLQGTTPSFANYNFVELVSKNTSLYVQQCCGKKMFQAVVCIE